MLSTKGYFLLTKIKFFIYYENINKKNTLHTCIKQIIG
jgi:hypothetical protein